MCGQDVDKMVNTRLKSVFTSFQWGRELQRFIPFFFFNGNVGLDD